MTGIKSAKNLNVSTLEEALNSSHLFKLSSVIDECKSILIIIENEQLTIDQLIEKLDQLILDAQKLRRDILISKTTGTSATVAGTVLTVVGFCLTPFTFGISTVVLPALGATLAGAGALTNIGASIADGCLTSNQATQITDLLEEFKKLQDCCYSKEIKLLKNLKLFTESSYDPQFDITKWLKKGNLHRDKKVDREELKMSDHIFRAIVGLPGLYHHAIYIDEKTVVELGGGISSASNYVQKISFSQFTANQPLYRRDYRGFALSPHETKKLALDAVRKNLEYSLITYNCEHFATSMKLKINWSGQVNTGFTITGKVGQNIARPISLIVDGVETGTKISAFATKVPPGLFSFFTTAPTPVMNTLAKASVILAPITIGIDISSLVYAYKEGNESIDICTKAIEDLKKMKLYLKERAKLFENMSHLFAKEREERKRLEALRLEEERRRLEALKLEEEERAHLEALQIKRQFNRFGLLLNAVNERIIEFGRKLIHFIKW